MTEPTLAHALWLGYKYFRRVYPCSPVTPERIAWALYHILSYDEVGRWHYSTGWDVLVNLYYGEGSPDLELVSCGSSWLVVERPQCPGVGIPCYREGGKIMWGGRNASTEA